MYADVGVKTAREAGNAEAERASERWSDARLRVLLQPRQRVQQAHAVLGRLPQPDDAARAHRDAGVARGGHGVQPVLERAGGAHLPARFRFAGEAARKELSAALNPILAGTEGRGKRGAAVRGVQVHETAKRAFA